MLQLLGVWPLGHDLQVRCPVLQVVRRTTGIQPMQGQQKSDIKVRQLWTGERHQDRGTRLCPKKLEAENKAKTSHTPTPKRPTTKQVNRKPSPIPLTNAWATLTVQEVENDPFQRKHQFHKQQPPRNQWK